MSPAQAYSGSNILIYLCFSHFSLWHLNAHRSGPNLRAEALTRLTAANAPFKELLERSLKMQIVAVLSAFGLGYFIAFALVMLRA
jgi:hypothetical protein